jgi:hypothetical protein
MAIGPIMATLSNAGTVKFSGTTAQVIGGSNATTFNHLTITIPAKCNRSKKK